MLDVSLFLLGLNVNAYALPNGVAPLVVLDFKNGVYQIAGVSKTVEQVIEFNADWSFHGFAYTDVIAGVGLTSDASGDRTEPAFTAAATATLIPGPGFTAVATVQIGDATDGTLLLDICDLPNFNNERQMDIANTVVAPENRVFLSDNSTLQYFPALGVGLHKLALTVIDTKMSMSIDGGVVGSLPVTVTTPSTNVVLRVAFPTVLETVSYYPAQADADLPGLST